jgi:Protein of unknown function (DUF3800)
MIFCDESSQAERFFVLGALYFALKADADHAIEIAKVEKNMREIKAKHGLHGRVKWEKVPSANQKNKLDGYKRLIKVFAATKQVRFKCMVLDTTKYPLDNRARWRGDALVGYLKFYCVFLSDGIMVHYPGHFYDIMHSTRVPTMAAKTVAPSTCRHCVMMMVVRRFCSTLGRSRDLSRYCHRVYC